MVVLTGSGDSQAADWDGFVFSRFGNPLGVQAKAYVPIFLLARRDEPWQKASSLRVKKEFIFNPADGGQENLGRQRNGGRRFDRLPIRCHFCRLRQSVET